jgi:hypothetical protein
MNQQTAAPQQVTSVKITAPELCRIHGWTVGGVYQLLDIEPTIRDKNGLDVNIESALWKRPVWISSSEYEIV